MNIRKSLIASVVVALVSGLILGSSTCSAAEPPLPANAIVLTTKRMCCAKESVPAIKEMNKIPGIGSVKANHKTRSLVIIPRQGGQLSPRAVWEAAERVKLDPIRLATSYEVHDAKPQR